MPAQTDPQSRRQRAALWVAIVGSCTVLVADLVRALLGHRVDWLQVAPALIVIVISAGVLRRTRGSGGES